MKREHPKFIVAKLLGYSGRTWPKDRALIDEIILKTGWSAPTKKKKNTFFHNFIVHLQGGKVAPIPIAIAKPPNRKNWRDDSKKFYASDEWKRLRYKALQICGGKCQCCGRSQRDGIILHVDHVKPRYIYKHLELQLSNLQVLCEDCNLGKGAWDDTDWRSDEERQQAEHMRNL